MQTDAVIDNLVRRVRPIPRFAVERRIGMMAAIGGAVSMALLARSFGVRPDLATAIDTPSFWMKAAYVGVILLIALTLLADFARPETNPSRRLALLAAPVLALSALAAVELFSTASSGWGAMIMGMTSGKCSLRIVFFAIPSLIALMAAFRRFAPTHLAQTGATIGAAAGAIGALVYLLYCRDVAAGFVLVWYTLGILATASVGALLGPKLLHWR
ncbi:MAG: hypothetical protein A3E78_13070 [Alphaproteobacteria bacterium RIFCSPHIGHO2_12_FULL_63_12]|nr:MAG: hypothetical protein A3E78_13070 [Alphaproteobacteria bacterium RIFCSPHIGHO2_12_FULL_63_12]